MTRYCDECLDKAVNDIIDAVAHEREAIAQSLE